MRNNANESKEDQNKLEDETRALLEATSNATEGAVIEARNRLKSALEPVKPTRASKRGLWTARRPLIRRSARIPIRHWGSPSGWERWPASC
jgi:hypothetical protein